MTVIAQSLLRRLRAAPEKDALRAGNNSGVVRGLQTAVIPNIRLGDVCMENGKVLVTDDADFALSGVGSSQYKRIPYVRALRLRLQNQTIYLQDVDICDKLYG